MQGVANDVHKPWYERIGCCPVAVLRNNVELPCDVVGSESGLPPLSRNHQNVQSFREHFQDKEGIRKTLCWPLYQDKARELRVTPTDKLDHLSSSTACRDSEHYVVVIHSRSTQDCSAGTEGSKTNSVKTHGKLFWSGVCIGIQSGDSLEQPTLHKPAGLNVAQEHGTERNPEALRPLFWQGTSLAQGLCKAFHDFWGFPSLGLLYKENLGHYGVTHLLTRYIYLLETPQCPQIHCPLSCHVPKHLIFVTWRPGESESHLYYISPLHQDSSVKWRWGGAKGAETFLLYLAWELMLRQYNLNPLPSFF